MSLPHVQTYWYIDGTKRNACNNQKPLFGNSNKMSCPLNVGKNLTLNCYYCSLNQTGHLVYIFRSLFAKNFFYKSKYENFLPVFRVLFNASSSLNYGLVCFPQTPTTQYWTCDGPNRQLHVGRSADQRRWQRTLDSGRMDTADYEVQHQCSYCDLMFSYRPVNNPHRDKPWNTLHCVVSFRLDCFTVLWTG